jgi:hypothetical protein
MWFTVNLLFEGVHVNRSDRDSLWQERLLLIRAGNEDEAQHQGEAEGRAREHDYVSGGGDQIRWQFRQVERVFPIDGEALDGGKELFSRFLHTSEVESMLTRFPE